MKRITKYLCFIVFSVFLAQTLFGCSSGKTVMTYKDSSISENEFQYYLATYKGKFKQVYTDYSDTADFYSTEAADGMTYGEYLNNMVIENVKRTLICDSLFHEMNLKLGTGIADQIDAYIEDYIKEYADGNKNVFNSVLSQYGINAKMLRNIYIRDEYASAVFDALYGSNGTDPITDEDRQEYLENNYVRIRHIYVNNKYVYETDQDGYPVYTDDGYKSTVPMTGETLKAKNDVISAIDESLADGGDFEEIYDAFSEDKYYEQGYYITAGTDFIADVVKSAFDLEIGEYVKIVSDYGTHYIKRLELEEKPWKEEVNADFFENFDSDVAESKFNDYLETLMPEVDLNNEILASYSVENSATNYRF